MSRSIPAKQSVTVTANERGLLDTECGRLVFTKYKGRHCAALLRGGRLTAAGFYNPAKPDKIGAVYIGKIKNIARNLDACFVEIEAGEVCFLPMKKAVHPFLTNRAYDGRLLQGDELLVQVERDAQKNKQACVTAHISLSDDYFAVVSGSSGFKSSARLSQDRKKRLARLLTEGGILQGGQPCSDPRALTDDPDLVDALCRAGLIPEEGAEKREPGRTLPPVGIVARTRLGELEDSGQVTDRFFRIATEFYRLFVTALTRSCFSCLSQVPPAWESLLRDLASPDEYAQIVTDDPELYRSLSDYCGRYLPDREVRLYQDKGLSLSGLYALESKMETALRPKVWLRSGGYLVIEPTEAMTVIDVNSGKNETGAGEDALCRINHEAAEEIALQLRLRNLSGIILVDFINMKEQESRNGLLEHLRELVRGDRVRTEAVDITPLGLAEITRAKKRQPLAEQFRESGILIR